MAQPLQAMGNGWQRTEGLGGKQVSKAIAIMGQVGHALCTQMEQLNGLRRRSSILRSCRTHETVEASSLEKASEQASQERRV